MVSIIMPVYNAGDVLCTTIDSILVQSYSDFELLLVDDGSTDDSCYICDKYANLDSRIKVFHKVNGGICDARNYGLKKATGDYIAFCDHDDLFYPELLEKTISCFTETGADAVKFRNEKVMDDGSMSYNTPKLYEKTTCFDFRHALPLFLSYGLLNTIWTYIYRSDLIKNNKIFFDTKYKHGGEDFNFNIRLYPYMKKIALLPDVLYQHFVRDSLSTSAHLHDDSLQMFYTYMFSVNNCLRKIGIRPLEIPSSYIIFEGNSLRRVYSYAIKNNRRYVDFLYDIRGHYDSRRDGLRFSIVDYYQAYKINKVASVLHWCNYHNMKWFMYYVYRWFL